VEILAQSSANFALTLLSGHSYIGRIARWSLGPWPWPRPRPRPRTTFKAKAKAKDLDFKAKAKAKDLSHKAKAKAKDLDFGLKDQGQGQGLTSLTIGLVYVPQMAQSELDCICD